jgi:hypothetical protein
MSPKEIQIHEDYFIYELGVEEFFRVAICVEEKVSPRGLKMGTNILSLALKIFHSRTFYF